MAYDADCGPCTRFRRVVGFLDAGRNLSFVSLAVADRTGVLEGVPARLRHQSFHLVSPGGEIQSGAEAIPALTRVLPAGRLTSWAMVTVPGGTRAARFVYGVFSRAHDSGRMCASPGSSGWALALPPPRKCARLARRRLSRRGTVAMTRVMGRA